jgi:hypothetical protein
MIRIKRKKTLTLRTTMMRKILMMMGTCLNTIWVIGELTRKKMTAIKKVKQTIVSLTVEIRKILNEGDPDQNRNRVLSLDRHGHVQDLEARLGIRIDIDVAIVVDAQVILVGHDRGPETETGIETENVLLENRFSSEQVFLDAHV